MRGWEGKGKGKGVEGGMEGGWRRHCLNYPTTRVQKPQVSNSLVLVGDLHEGVKSEVSLGVFRPMRHASEIHELKVIERSEAGRVGNGEKMRLDIRALGIMAGRMEDGKVGLRYRRWELAGRKNRRGRLL